MRPLRATYRVQFGPDFNFGQAEDLVSYWSVLGISHLYLSPVFTARSGSSHGYDVVDHETISAELGGEAGLRQLARRLNAAGMGIILDIVPNHTGAGGSENAHWLGLLEFGEAGPDTKWFDVDWTRGPLILPILGETLAEAITGKHLVPFWDKDHGQIGIRYHDHRLPLGPSTVSRLLLDAGKTLNSSDTVRALAKAWEGLGDGGATRQSIAALRRGLCTELANPYFEAEVLRRLQEQLSDPDEAMGVQRHLFEQQAWRLAHWRIARDELNYRRFFSISDLAALRVEDPEVFQTIHALPLRLLKEGVVDGFRVDHVDGLADPAAYCRQLRDAAGPAATIHVEKILARTENLRPWPIDGTTGYEILNLINGLFIDPDGYQQIAQNAEKLGLSPPPGNVADRVAAAKREILEQSFVTELGVLTKLAKAVADRSLQTADFTDEAIRRSLSDLLVAFPVYRSYLTDAPCDPSDKALVETANAAASANADPWHQTLNNFVCSILIDREADQEVLEFRRRFQQLTVPLMAKGYEDTELYRHLVLLSANEVGSSLDNPAVSADEFHTRAANLQRDLPKNLVPLATHDTKWGAAARARLNLLSECARQWVEASEEWSSLSAGFRTVENGGNVPSPLDEMRIFQAIFGCWPVTVERLEAYLVKAIREARLHGGWESPDEIYENGTTGFARQLGDSPKAQEFRRRFSVFLEPLIGAGRLNALAQTIIQLTMPGIPDIYWGGEFWDHVFVDPDNRRPVSWDRRKHALREIPALSEALSFDGIDADDDGITKLAVIQRLLGLRQRWPALFDKGEYRALELQGTSEAQSRWLAYCRQVDGLVLVVVVPVRGLGALAARGREEGTIELPAAWTGMVGRDIISGVSLVLGRVLDLSSALSVNPVAVILAHRDALDA